MELWKIYHQTQHEIEVRHDQLMGVEPDLLILHEMVSYQDRYLHVSGVTNWAVQIYCIALHYYI